MRDVELASQQIAQRFENEEFAIPPSRLSDIETKGITPSIFRLYSFAAIYRREYRELLSFYGLELDGISADLNFGRSAEVPPIRSVGQRVPGTDSDQIRSGILAAENDRLGASNPAVGHRAYGPPRFAGRRPIYLRIYWIG